MIIYLEEKIEESYTRTWLVVGIGKLQLRKLTKLDAF